MTNNFSYTAHMKASNLVENQEFPGEVPKEDLRIINMSNLTPMSITWQTRDNRSNTFLAYLDFINNKIYDKNHKEIKGVLGESILEILMDKKTKTLEPDFPFEIIDVMENRDKLKKEYKNKNWTA